MERAFADFVLTLRLTLRLNRAATRLPQELITRIAPNLSFNQPQHFNAAIKVQFQTTPREY